MLGLLFGAVLGLLPILCAIFVLSPVLGLGDVIGHVLLSVHGVLLCVCLVLGLLLGIRYDPNTCLSRCALPGPLLLHNQLLRLEEHLVSLNGALLLGAHPTAVRPRRARLCARSSSSKCYAGQKQ